MDVSCRVFPLFFRAARGRAVDVARLAEGTGYDVAHLSRVQERVEWGAFRRFMRNAREVFGEDGLVELGVSFLDAPVLKPFNTIARLLFTTREFYLWMNRAGIGGQLYRCMDATAEEVDAGHLRIHIHMAEGYAACPEFFLVTRGSFMALPTIFGQPRAKVDVSFDDDGGTFDIRYRQGGGLLAWLRRAITWPFTARSAAKQLKDAYELLEERYDDLAEARGRVARQARGLETAHSISQLIHGDLALASTLNAIARALVEEGGFCAVELLLSAHVEDRLVSRREEFGSRNERAPLRRHVVSRGQDLGEVLLWPRDDEHAEEAPDLLHYVMPTISMALSNALTYTTVRDYRDNLERKVEERTEQLEAAKQRLQESVTSLERAQAARDRIFANINHEIRTPLSVIQLISQQVAQREDASDELRAAVEPIRLHSRHLASLLDDLLLLAAGDEGKLRTEKRDIDLANLVSSVCTAWQAPAADAGVVLDYFGPRSLAYSADPLAMERVVVNLVSNAIKFTPAGGNISVHVEEDGGEVRLCVRDTGIGIPPGDEERVFGRFEQGLPPVRAGGRGSGIGLSLVRELSEAHGGTATARRLPEGGTAIDVCLPRTAVGGADAVALTNSAPLPIAPGAAQPAVIEAVAEQVGVVLIAEDDPQLRAALGELLRRRHRVLLASDGLAALRMAQEHAPDLLITDLSMPGMDGVELTRRFRQLEGNALAPAILLTARTGRRERLEAFGAGAVDYVHKPFDPDELLARVHAQLAIRDLALQLHERERLASLGALSSALAHELRNPANTLVQLVPLLKKKLDVIEPGMAELLGAVETAVGTVRHAVEDMIEFEHPDAAALGPIVLADVVERARASVSRVHPETRFVVKVPPELSALAHASMVQQVLQVLLDNAARSMDSEDPIVVDAAAHESVARIDVSDSGPGVPRALRSRIFDPFLTTRAPGEGSGLGLYAARQIADRLNGSLRLLETPRGATFRLELPLATDDTALARVG